MSVDNNPLPQLLKVTQVRLQDWFRQILVSHSMCYRVT